MTLIRYLDLRVPSRDSYTIAGNKYQPTTSDIPATVALQDLPHMEPCQVASPSAQLVDQIYVIICTGGWIWSTLPPIIRCNINNSLQEPGNGGYIAVISSDAFYTQRSHYQHRFYSHALGKEMKCVMRVSQIVRTARSRRAAQGSRR